MISVRKITKEFLDKVAVTLSNLKRKPQQVERIEQLEFSFGMVREFYVNRAVSQRMQRSKQRGGHRSF